ncbi:stage V sporulation protein D (sporulation-specific penicillin-binding protein) [Alteribacillus persepolensis]|uniref:serine-type D-Ala-D-Ala carboxypeptidase n=1 Tax=Alteribacillus persepolensis TaxID=568899 RepID=A0A1G7YGJ9_9BACI|nr:stage V sporulation protein D [Alteribacillus persepolensis]SDG94980.1 stage V sporulation protein D (sporulation-specific penicillin-binding protein) [Alteribacillus persepolensis]
MRVSFVTVRKRLFFVLIAGAVAIFILLLRLGYVQFSMGEWLSDLAEDSWSRDVPFEAERGEILDRNGDVLATNVSAPSVLAVPRQIEDPEDAASKLAEVLGVSFDKAHDWVTENERIVRLTPEGRKISKEKATEVRDLDIEGIYIAEDNKRHYPKGKFLSHVLGFAGIDNQGLTGIEQYYDERLKGEPGRVSFFSDAKGQRMEGMADQYERPQQGENLRLTIDARVQTIIERELDIAEATYNPDGALAIAVDPDSGEILGMSSRPDFHPEDYREVPPEIYNQNKPVWSQYEPGSTFKIITLAAALEEGKVNLEDDHFHDPGYIEVNGTKLRCWKKGGHGEQTFLEVVQNSCNPGFVVLGERLGKDTLFDYIEKFGFGRKTGIDLQGEGTGILFNRDNVGPLELATTAFGQGVSVTPLQQVMAVSAAVNGGYLYEPYLAKEWLDPVTGQVLESQPSNQKQQIISEETSEKVRDALEHVVAKGTGKGAFRDGYRIGGKTGTAQKAVGGKYLENNHIVSFIGFAPADDPEIVVYTAIDNPKDTLQFGGIVAAPIVGNIIEDSLAVMGVERRDNQIEKELTWDDEALVDMPDMVGLTLKELHDAYYPLNIETQGEGSVIISQAPEPGEKIKEGATIRLYLGDKTEASD